MALTGDEIVYVQGVQANGQPGAIEFPTTTQDIANLGEGGGDPTFNSVTFDGSTSGSTTVEATAIAGTTTLTLPAATDTLVGKATTDTLTNKTLTAPVLGGSVTGTYTLAGTPTITAPTITLANITLAASHVGTFTANGATPVSVSNTTVTANSVIIFTLKTVGGTVGAYPAIQTITASTGFTVAATASDTSVYNYAIIG